MTTAPEDGGPAFPLPYVIDEIRGVKIQYEVGMTLRDYFAGQALAGLMAHPESGMASAQKVSSWSYEIASAMLSERRRSSGGGEGK